MIWQSAGCGWPSIRKYPVLLALWCNHRKNDFLLQNIAAGVTTVGLAGKEGGILREIFWA